MMGNWQLDQGQGRMVTNRTAQVWDGTLIPESEPGQAGVNISCAISVSLENNSSTRTVVQHTASLWVLCTFTFNTVYSAATLLQSVDSYNGVTHRADMKALIFIHEGDWYNNIKWHKLALMSYK